MKKLLITVSLLLMLCMMLCGCENNDVQGNQEPALENIESQVVSVTDDKLDVSMVSETSSCLDLSEFGEIDNKTLEKIGELKKEMTVDQVHDILGEPDWIAPTGILWECYYINGNENRWIQVGYFSDGISVQLSDIQINKHFTIF